MILFTKNPNPKKKKREGGGRGPRGSEFFNKEFKIKKIFFLRWGEEVVGRWGGGG